MTTYSSDSALPRSLWRGQQADTVPIVERRGRFGDAFIFVLPLLLPIESTVGGQLFLPEVILLLFLPFLLDDARRRNISRISHVAVVLGGLWLFGLIFTDIYRGTSFHDYSRGWANVAFFLVDFAGLSLLVDGRWRRVMLFAAGLALGEALQFFLTPSLFAAGDPWKFGYGSSVTLASVLFAASIRRRPLVATGILIALGVINLKMGFRSLGGICFLTALMVVLAARSGHLIRFDRRPLRTMAALVASVLVGLVVVSAYEYAARNGVLGGKAEQKYSAQHGNLGIVVGGRPEILASALAIRDSPLIGHGSWAKDPTYAAALQQKLFQAGYPISQREVSSGLIPTGSYLFGAWVDGGVLGAVFWAWTLVITSSVLLRIHRLADSGRVALVAFLGFSFLWAVFFSPFGAEARIAAAFSLVVFVMAQEGLPAQPLPKKN